MSCSRCSLLGVPQHEDPQGCIDALRQALVRQKHAAETLAFDISTRFLAALESLVVDPDEGIGYQSGNQQISASQVSGIYSSIWRRYKALGDWSQLRELEDKNKALHDLLGRCSAPACPLVVTPGPRCSPEPESSPTPSTPGEPSGQPPRT